MQTAKNLCDGERVKKLGIWMASKQGTSYVVLVEFVLCHVLEGLPIPPYIAEGMGL